MTFIASSTVYVYDDIAWCFPMLINDVIIIWKFVKIPKYLEYLLIIAKYTK